MNAHLLRFTPVLKKKGPIRKIYVLSAYDLDTLFSYPDQYDDVGRQTAKRERISNMMRLRRDSLKRFATYHVLMKITVKCYSGHRGDEKPQSIRLDSLVVQVTQILDRWLAPDHRYFKFIGDDKAAYIIRQDMDSLDWELIFYQETV